MTDELKYQIALGNVNGIGPILAKQLITTIGTAKDVMATKASVLQKIDGVGQIKANAIANYKDYNWIDEEIKFINKHQIQTLFFTDDNYPTKLKQCIDAPILLYYKGNANLNAQKIISIVGRRKNTEYGRKITENLIEKIAKYNPLIISGLAVGIDIIAHKSALQNNIKTIGVLAHGLDRIYPPNHKNTATEMVNQGGLLSEYPSGTIPNKENFPTRNRIVAGIADATIVIETDVKGGSMITANLANSYNRDVMAFPNSVYANTSSGCHQLIKSMKANIITDAQDLIELLNWDDKSNKKTAQRELYVELSENENLIYNLLQKNGVLNIDELTNLSNLNPSLIASATLSLEIQNIILSLPGKVFQLL